jgi:hypothetical protein
MYQVRDQSDCASGLAIVLGQALEEVVEGLVYNEIDLAFSEQNRSAVQCEIFVKRQILEVALVKWGIAEGIDWCTSSTIVRIVGTDLQPMKDVKKKD